jgi:nuclear pore complex protein Nup155
MSFAPVTPARPVPGAFVNTPGPAPRYPSGQDPVRRQLFNTADASQTVSAPSQQNSATAPQISTVATVPGSSILPVQAPEDLPPVVKAAKAINSFLQLDENFIGLDTYSGRKNKSHIFA